MKRCATKECKIRKEGGAGVTPALLDVAPSVLKFSRSRKVLVLMLALFSALIADSLRPASEQITAQIYVAAVQAYQLIGRPFASHWVHCRYQPTCSVYSIQAVRTHGIAKGLYLTGCRLVSCFPNVPYGTLDPVPPAVSGLIPNAALEAKSAAFSVLSLIGFSIVLVALRSRPSGCCASTLGSYVSAAHAK